MTPKTAAKNNPVLFSDFMFPAGQRFIYNQDRQGEFDVITEAGQKAIDDYIKFELKRPGLPLFWSYRWFERSGVYQGNFPTRVEQWLWKNWRQPLPPTQKTILGNLARRHINNYEAVAYDFVERIAWEPGDFGELPNNCLWPAHASKAHPDSRNFVDRHPRIMFLRLFHPKPGQPGNRSLGLGRAIVYGYKWPYPALGDTPWSYLVFNSHGICAGNDMAAMILKAFLDGSKDRWHFAVVKATSPHMDVNSNHARHVYAPLYHRQDVTEFFIE